MLCTLSWHKGNREVVKLRTLISDDHGMVEGCLSCTDGFLNNMYPGTKRLVVSKGTGKHYWISPAHVRDIKMRRCAPDLSHVWYDRKGLGSNMRY